PTTSCYTLSLHDALPIFAVAIRDADQPVSLPNPIGVAWMVNDGSGTQFAEVTSLSPFVITAPRSLVGGIGLPVFAGEFVQTFVRSEEHTSELQSHLNLVC